MEDVEEAFIRTPDSRPLLVYLNMAEKATEREGTSCLSSAARRLLEKVNNADKAAKIKVRYASAKSFYITQIKWHNIVCACTHD